MPKIYEYLEFTFFLHPNDHLPLHCHVKSAGCESKVDISFESGVVSEVSFVAIKGKTPIPQKDRPKIKKFIISYGSAIAFKWFQFSILKQPITSEKITTRL
ncbi:MAG: DUF4160 domain-containing protein [Ignavibacteria bacterium]|nr:DUF4160 domain-containing protein [Ignavibacteria bacterium]